MSNLQNASLIVSSSYRTIGEDFIPCLTKLLLKYRHLCWHDPATYIVAFFVPQLKPHFWGFFIFKHKLIWK